MSSRKEKNPKNKTKNVPRAQGKPPKISKQEQHPARAGNTHPKDAD